MYIYHYPANQNPILFSISSTKQEIIKILYHAKFLFKEQELPSQYLYRCIPESSLNNSLML